MKRNLFPARTLRRLIATTASGGMLGQSVLGAALSLPVLMIATPAQAATACSASIPNTVAIYQSGTTVSAPTMRPYFSCTGAGSQYARREFAMCFVNGTTSSAGQTGSPQQSGNMFLARSSTGSTIKFDLYFQYTDYSSGSFSVASEGASSNASLGNTNADSNGNASTGVPLRSNSSWQLLLNIPNQSSVAAGTYSTIISMPLQYWIRNSGDYWWGYNFCTGTSIATGTLALPITINVTNSCDVAAGMSIDFGQLTQTNAVLDTKSTYFQVAAVCPKSVNYTLTLSDGVNASGSGSYRRRMANGNSYVAYGIFTDRNASTPFPTGGVSLTGTGVSSDYGNAYYYANIAPSQSTASLASGQYNDTIIAMVNW
ncbi:hypothetical protein BSZ14_05070 [Sphingomonas sp. Sph1(2015)]|uniref:Csu type fimbrial protein n=1 Tax=Sphingomonas sp. Sph1(2015) TaxID=1628084 RepID=UPI000977DD1E|nr:spore coat protein U domain-containing protein [Sphingomonas sp. Sph1(2015)]OMJ32978.1 hypothetical protein BSZ14_05070 [Sphingomonas sp. Sph1(2015)]